MLLILHYHTSDKRLVCIQQYTLSSQNKMKSDIENWVALIEYLIIRIRHFYLYTSSGRCIENIKVSKYVWTDWRRWYLILSCNISTHPQKYHKHQRETSIDYSFIVFAVGSCQNLIESLSSHANISRSNAWFIYYSVVIFIFTSNRIASRYQKCACAMHWYTNPCVQKNNIFRLEQNGK